MSPRDLTPRDSLSHPGTFPTPRLVVREGDPVKDRDVARTPVDPRLRAQECGEEPGRPGSTLEVDRIINVSVGAPWRCEAFKGPVGDPRGTCHPPQTPAHWVSRGAGRPVRRTVINTTCCRGPSTVPSGTRRHVRRPSTCSRKIPGRRPGRPTPPVGSHPRGDLARD